MTILKVPILYICIRIVPGKCGLNFEKQRNDCTEVTLRMK